MATDKMIAEKDGAIGKIIFNSPERRNAVSLEMWQALGDMVTDFGADDDVRVIVLEGAGDKAFVAGADISRFGEERSNADEIARYSAIVTGAMEALYTAPKPTIAKIRGFCIGGGLGIAVSCDMRICSDDSQFAIPAARLGLGYPHGNLRKLTDVVGPSTAKEIFFTAKRFSAAEALEMRLVNRVVPAAELDDFVADYAGRIGDNAPLTLKQVKGTIGELMKDSGERDLDWCDQLVKECFDSADYVEGRTAFMEKRRAEFKGR